MFLAPRPGARRYPQDLQAGESLTANLMVKVLREGMEDGSFRKDNVWGSLSKSAPCRTA